MKLIREASLSRDPRKQNFQLLEEDWKNLLNSDSGLVREELVEELPCPVSQDHYLPELAQAKPYTS